MLTCLRAFIGSQNFKGKRLFIEQFNGLAVLTKMVCADPGSEIKKSLRLQKKVLMIIYDLLLNDDNIKPEDRSFTRRSLGGSEVFIKTMLTDLLQSDAAQHDYREYILKILFRIYQVVVSLGDTLKPVLFEHRAKLSAIEQTEATTAEIALIDDVLAAPTRPMIVNFEPTEESKEGSKQTSSLQLKD